jgi:3'-phosphoadenosine 5'-phosphosulfate sulfotransferase (PAPS reductase)/FAD synthetase
MNSTAPISGGRVVERDADGVLHIVALSGGHDSTILSFLLKEREPRPYTYVCTPTGDELPEMFDFWLWLGTDEALGKRLLPIIGGTLKGIVKQEKAIPNNRMRFCTRKLKIEPYRRFLVEQAALGPVVSYVGLRADEEGRAGGAYDDIAGVTMRFPLREWGMGETEVQAGLAERGINVPDRTDCARCYHQQLGEWWRLWHDYPEIYADAEGEEAEIGHSWRNPSRDNWPARLADLRGEFEAGKVPRATVRQHDMFRRVGQCRACTL